MKTVLKISTSNTLQLAFTNQSGSLSLPTQGTSLLHETRLSFKTAVVKDMKILTHRICNSVVFLEDKVARDILINSFLSSHLKRTMLDDVKQTSIKNKESNYSTVI